MTTMLRAGLRHVPLSIALLMLVVLPAFAQSLASDQADYQPGTIATFTGAGYAPGEEVLVHVGHADETGDAGAGHDSWSVLADEAGGFVTTWLVCTDDCAGSTLRATAHGVTSNLEASCTFTDSVLSLVITSWSPMGVVNSLPATILVNFDYSTSPLPAITRARLVVENQDTTELWATAFLTLTSGASLGGSLSLELPAGSTDGAYTVRVLMTNTTMTKTPPPLAAIVPDAFIVQVEAGTTPPSVNCATLDGGIVNTTGQDCAAVVDLSALFTQGINVFGNPAPVVTFSPPASTLLPVGAHSITVTAANGAGPDAVCTLAIEVKDSTPPLFQECGAAVSLIPKNGCEYLGALTPPNAIDNCGGPVTISSNAPAVFPSGLTHVTWTAADAAGNQSSCGQDVVIESSPVSLLCAATQTVGTNAGCAYVGGITGPTLAGGCGGVINLTSDAPAEFPLGETTVTWTASNGSGVLATCNQVLTVVDDDAPALTCPPNVSVTLCDAIDLGPASADDACDPGPLLANNAPGTFPIGTTSVAWTAMDAAGNSASCAQLVQVTYGALDGFLPPLFHGDLVVNVKRGRTVPVKFRLAGCAGMSGAIAHISVQQLPMGVDLDYTDITILGTGPSDGGTLFRYSGGDGLYIYNLGTSNLQLGRTYRIRATLLDGQVLESLIQVLR